MPPPADPIARPIPVARTFMRFAAVSLLTNLAGYLAFIIATAAGVGPKTALTVLYVLAVSASYFGNRQWAFRQSNGARGTPLRFAVAHVLGYALNFSLLVVFVDRLGYPHQLVQAAAIVVVAVYLFAALRLFVFVGPASQRL